MKHLKNLTIALIFIVSCYNLKAFQLLQDTTQMPKIDSIRYKLNFIPGDTILYNAVSFDSIIVNFGNPLMRARNEVIRFVCDSVSSNGHFFISNTLINYTGFESSDSVKNQKVEKTNWLNRRTIVEIDSFGKRYNAYIDEPQKPGSSPGGPFQPTLFFNFGSDYHKNGENWMESDTLLLVENGNPAPIYDQNMLFKARVDSVDTLSYICNRIEFISTGQGAIDMFNSGPKFKITCVTNGYGTYDISKLLGVPVHFFETIEQKLTIHKSGDEHQTGFHYISTNYSLMEYIPKALQKHIKERKSNKKKK